MGLERPIWPESFERCLEQARTIPPEDRQARRESSLAALDETRVKADAEHQIKICRSLSEIGARFEDRTLENFQVDEGNREAYQTAREIIDDETLGAYFFGDVTGNGKSHLAGAIVNACMAKNIPGIFITGVTLLMRIRDTYTKRGNVRDGELDIVDKMTTVPVLALDDLGTERFSEDTARIFYAIVNGRYENKRPLIVTSNLSPAQLYTKWTGGGIEEQLGHKIIDRLRDMCTFKVEVTSLSRRGVA